MIVSVSFTPPPRHTAVLDAVNRGAHLFVSERTSDQISWPPPFSFRGRQHSGLLAATVQNLMAADTRVKKRTCISSNKPTGEYQKPPGRS